VSNSSCQFSFHGDRLFFIDSFLLYALPKSQHYVLIDNAEIHTLPITRVRSHLKDRGFSYYKPEGELSEIDKVIINAERHRKIAYCGELAGHAPGYFERNGIAYICSQGPTLIEPVKGNWDTLRTWLEKMLKPTAYC